MNRIGHWINNKVVLGTSGRSGVVFNPATGEEQAQVDFASVAEMDAVVAASKAALPGWRATSLSRRAEIMFRMRELVDANRKEIANIVSLEHGKVPHMIALANIHIGTMAGKLNGVMPATTPSG
ncbi:MAG: aldehyde dehydrogenase family protein [Actinomycetota bacterium]